METMAAPLSYSYKRPLPCIQLIQSSNIHPQMEKYWKFLSQRIKLNDLQKLSVVLNFKSK